MLVYYTEYFCTFRSARDHFQGINSKKYRITPLLYALDMVKYLKILMSLICCCASILGLDVLENKFKNIKKLLKHIDVQNIHKIKTERQLR